jgi:hypothetical protein
MRFRGMRNEDYDRELLVFVTFICVVLTASVSLLETTAPTVAKVAQAPTRVEQLEPVRVVGTPFVLNTNPRER